jgi:hypothetical protein
MSPRFFIGFEKEFWALLIVVGVKKKNLGKVAKKLK